MTFEETCRELDISEAELEQLVAAGEIASIKEGDTLFFKADAVARYKESRGDDTILLSDEELSLLDEQVYFFNQPGLGGNEVLLRLGTNDNIEQFFIYHR